MMRHSRKANTKPPDYRFCRGPVTVYCARVLPGAVTVRRRVLPRAWLDCGRRFGSEGRGSTRLVGAVAENEFLLIVPLENGQRAFGPAHPGGECVGRGCDICKGLSYGLFAGDGWEEDGQAATCPCPAHAPGPAWADVVGFWAMDEELAEGYFTLNRGDRVLAGVGPCVTGPEEWAAFVPANVPGLCVVGAVKPQLGMDGRILHLEAGQ